ncbi:MAG: hypothetical protein M1830_004557 [Pleopsidium flavum]|nr:MAG: hypothetical protein M1830_004557 [Pleopsidium flavum]
MNNSNDPVSLKYYPAYCFSVSPTLHTWVKLTAADVHALATREGFEGQKIYFHLNHAIKWIRVVGVIVAMDDYEKRWIMVVDDSSGATLEVTCAKPAPDAEATGTGIAHGKGKDVGRATSASGIAVDLCNVDIGTVVKLKGGIGEFRGFKQMTLERISIINTTDEEAQCWSELTRFQVEVLSEPWYVPPETQQRLLEEADGTRRRKEEKERRRRERKGRRAGKVGRKKRRESDKENQEGHGIAEEESRQERGKREKTAAVEDAKKRHRREDINGGLAD